MQHCSDCGHSKPLTRNIPAPCQPPSGGSCSQCWKVHLLNAEIVETHKHLESLLQQRDRILTTESNRRHDLLTRRLPLELVSYIFELIVRGDKARGLSLNLGGICQAWRKIAWTTPRLWATIVIKIGNVEADLNILQGYIGRSGRLPLTISLRMTRPNGGVWDLSNLDQVIDAVNGCSDRWRSLELELPTPILERFRGRCRSPFGAPQLTDLTLVPVQYGGLQKMGRFSLENSRPRPSKLHFKHLYANHIEIDWSHLTVVHADEISLSDAFDILRYAPRLTNCVLGFQSQGEFAILQNPSTLTHCLHTLRLDLQCTETDIRLFFNNLTLPRLKHLVITSCRTKILPADALLSLLRRSSCPLTALIMRQPFVEVQDLIEILKRTPSLEKVGVNTVPTTFLDPLFHLLIANSDSPIVPSLQYLHVSGTLASWDPVLVLCLPERFCPQICRRPLSDLAVRTQAMAGRVCPVIDKDVVPFILERISEGVAIQFLQASKGGDPVDLMQGTGF